MKKLPLIDPTANVLLFAAEKDRRQNDLRESESKALRREMKLRAHYDAKLRKQERNRLDAIRLVDQGNVDKAADRVLAAVQTLAATNKTDTETLRSLVASTAATLATQHEATVRGINDRIAILEKSSYEGKGRGGGVQALWGWILGGAGLIGVVFTVIKAFH